MISCNNGGAYTRARTHTKSPNNAHLTLLLTLNRAHGPPSAWKPRNLIRAERDSVPREQDRSQVSGRGEGLGLGAAVVCVLICLPCRPVECGVWCAVLIAAHCTGDVTLFTPSAPLYKSRKLDDVSLARVV